MSLGIEAKLAKLAALSIHSGVGLLPGQELIISADVSCAPLVRMMQEEAYRAGAKNVFTLYSDEAGSLIRYLHGSSAALDYAPAWFYDAAAAALETGGAYLMVSAANPGLLKDIDPPRVAAAAKAHALASKKLRDVVSGAKANWCGIPYATVDWAKKVFPELADADALAKLWEAIFSTTRVDAEDPAAAWRGHCEHLEARAKFLTERRFEALHFKGPGTDLRVGLAVGHIWVSGRLRTENGAVCIPNMPTEEVFTMPHRNRVDGIVRSTKPLSVRGTVLEGIEVEFFAGRVVHARADRGEEQLTRLLETDEGARFLGEVALVPNSSCVSQTGLLFFNTLFDENAASHIALGQAYAETIEGGSKLSDSQKNRQGMNESLIHVDWMIGSSEIDVDGIAASGSPEPLMRSGEWA
jgi:aminopeptidase